MGDRRMTRGRDGDALPGPAQRALQVAMLRVTPEATARFFGPPRIFWLDFCSFFSFSKTCISGFLGHAQFEEIARLLIFGIQKLCSVLGTPRRGFLWMCFRLRTQKCFSG